MINNKKIKLKQNIIFIILLLINLFTTKNLLTKSRINKISLEKEKDNFNYNFLQSKLKTSIKSTVKNLNTNTIKKTKTNETTKQIMNLGNLNPLQAFLETIASKKETSFCMKVFVGKPEKHRSYNCPPNMFILDSNVNTCQKKCPTGMIQNISNCEMPCKNDYQKINNLCVNNSSKKNYKIISSPIEISDPICKNGYFLNGFCNSCMGNSDYSNGICLSPCKKGAPSESFCAFNDSSNKNLSIINVYWADFLRGFYKDIFELFKTGILKRDIYTNAENLNEIAKILVLNKEDNKIRNDSGKVIIYLRDKFAINMSDSKLFLRNILFKMFTRYAIENKEISNIILNVVDDLINFSGDYRSPYLDTKQYGITGLPLTVANLIEHYLCDKN
jgi:hypothetical protein